MAFAASARRTGCPGRSRWPGGSLALLRTYTSPRRHLHRSAAVLRATLTDDATAIAGASAAVTRLDAMIEAMRRDGTK
jgi:hypothetical protein